MLALMGLRPGYGAYISVYIRILKIIILIITSAVAYYQDIRAHVNTLSRRDKHSASETPWESWDLDAFPVDCGTESEQCCCYNAAAAAAKMGTCMYAGGCDGPLGKCNSVVRINVWDTFQCRLCSSVRTTAPAL